MSDIDLHIHSCYSDDADFTPQEIIKRAVDKDLAAIGIADHNTTEAIPEAMHLAQKRELEVVPAIELDTNYRDTNLHILGYYFDWQGEELVKLLAGLEEAKQQQLKERIQRLEEIGFEIELSEVLAKSDADRPPGGFVAKMVLAHPENQKQARLQPYLNGEKSNQAAFNFYLDYFTPGGEAYIPCQKPTAKEAIQTIRNLGGIAVVAHPGYTLEVGDQEIFTDLKEAGLEGLEVYSTYHSSEEIEGFSQLAAEFDLLATAGSDFHGQLKPEIEIGGVENNRYQLLKRLKTRVSNR